MPVIALDLARRHVRRARQMVDDQRRRIAWLKRVGDKSTISENLLVSFEETLAIFEGDLARLERQS